MDAVSEYVKAYQEESRVEPNHKGSEKLLKDEETQELSKHLESKIYTKTKDIKHYIKETFKKDLSLSGIRLWLKRNDFTFKKPKIVPANTDPIAQQKFIEHYEKMMNEAAALEEPVLFGINCPAAPGNAGFLITGSKREKIR